MRGFRCHKCIYLTIHHPELEAPITPDLQALFDQGNEVGVKARDYYPGGVLVDNKPWDFIGAVTKTQELLTQNTATIYEAAFNYKGCYARVDIIQYVPATKKWRIYEVKSTTKIKDEHYDDITIQAWVMAKTGLPIEQINIVHLNPDCYYPDLSQLFREVDITNEIRDKYLSIQPKIRDIFSIITHPEIPNIDIGPYCHQPTPCGFIDYCWQQKHIPEVSIFNLPKINTRKWDLYHAGIIHLDDARLSDLTESQQRMVNCFKTGTRYVNHDVIQKALTDWQFPLIFLDFETINPAIPQFEGCKPFSHVPFQFSVHILNTLESDVIHHEFLHATRDDPRPALIPALLAACQQQGSVVAYFSKFEAERIQALADFSPTHYDVLMQLIDRLVDPLPIIRDAVYDNAFQGSFSLKNVAPAILGTQYGYDGMQVANGNDAQRAFQALISPSISIQEKTSIKNAMLDYCKKDTEVMLELVKWLYNQITK